MKWQNKEHKIISAFLLQVGTAWERKIKENEAFRYKKWLRTFRQNEGLLKHPTEVFIHLANLSSFNFLQKENKYLPLQESCLSCKELNLNYLARVRA